MKRARRLCAMLLCFSCGCDQPTTIGGLCLGPCAAVDACALAPCPTDAGTQPTPQDAGTPDSGPLDAGASCDGALAPPGPTQLDLLLVVDDSASLLPWFPALQEGLAQILQDEAWHGVGVGLQRFDEVCEPAAYANLLVPIATLPDNASALEAAFPLVPTGSTSTAPALAGTLQYARDWAATRSDSYIAVVLLTDASPGACDGLIGDYVGEAQRVAREAYEATPSIPTYVVALGVMEQVTMIAPAGGTQTMLINAVPASGEVKAALDRIRIAASEQLSPPSDCR